MQAIPEIKLYGTVGCHKTQYYKAELDKIGLPYEFLDVKENKEHEMELRSLYESGKLNFPTITIGEKKLRNPQKDELYKWINKLIPQQLELRHDRENSKYVLDINGEEAKVEYRIRNDKMYLTHSEVPHQLRGRGIGKILVEKTFEKLNEDGHSAVAICPFIKAVARRSEKWNSIIG